MSKLLDSDRGYDGQSEDDSDESDERPHHRRKRFTRRSHPAPVLPDSSPSQAGSSGQTDHYRRVERSDSGHSLFYDPELKAWRRHETGVRTIRKPNACLRPEEETPTVRQLRRTPSGSKVIYDMKKRCWRRTTRRKTVNYNSLTEAQRNARKTASGTDIYYDQTRFEWRRRTQHDSDVVNPSKAQIALKRTGSGSGMVYDKARQVWKRKLKRKLITDPKYVDMSQYPNCKLVQSHGQWYLQKKRKHLEPSELSEKQIAARRTGSGTPIFYDEVMKKWQRLELLPVDRPSSRKPSMRRRHRHHHGSKRQSYAYTKNKLTGRWTKKSFEPTESQAKRVCTSDGGFIYFDYNRNRWRKCALEGADGGEARKMNFFARLKEFFLGDSEESIGESISDDNDELATPDQTHDGQRAGQRTADTQKSKNKGGFMAMIRRFFRAICCWLRLC